MVGERHKARSYSQCGSTQGSSDGDTSSSSDGAITQASTLKFGGISEGAGQLRGRDNGSEFESLLDELHSTAKIEVDIAYCLAEQRALPHFRREFRQKHALYSESGNYEDSLSDDRVLAEAQF